MCQFESLYFEDDGYVIRCKDCGNYQMAYGNALLSLTDVQLSDLYKNVIKRNFDEDVSLSEHSKCISIPILKYDFHLLFTKKELTRLYEILEIVDTEIKTLSLLNLF